MSGHVARSGSGECGQQQQQSISTQFTDVGLEQLRRDLQAFAAQREWEQYHTPRNLLLALVGEVGELSEIFQWRGEVIRQEKSHTAQQQLAAHRFTSQRQWLD